MLHCKRSGISVVRWVFPFQPLPHLLSLPSHPLQHKTFTVSGVSRDLVKKFIKV